jgi:hypothetical protein
MSRKLTKVQRTNQYRLADEDKDGEITKCNKMLEYITKDDNSDIKWEF